MLSSSRCRLLRDSYRRSDGTRGINFSHNPTCHFPYCRLPHVGHKSGEFHRKSRVHNSDCDLSEQLSRNPEYRLDGKSHNGSYGFLPNEHHNSTYGHNVLPAYRFDPRLLFCKYYRNERLAVSLHNRSCERRRLQHLRPQYSCHPYSQRAR
jgi:hypothetical protein